MANQAESKPTARTAEARKNGAPGMCTELVGSIVALKTVVNSTGPIIPAIPLSELFAPDNWPWTLGSTALDIKPWMAAEKNPIKQKITVEAMNIVPLSTIP